MRAFLTGTIHFSLVTIPVKFYTATKDLTPQFHQIHTKCNGRITMARRCAACACDVEWAEIGKGHEVDGKMVAFTNEELKALEGDVDSGDITVESAVAPGDVEATLHEKTYWLGPGGDKHKKGAAAPSYTLLLAAMNKTGLELCVTIKMRTRTRFALLAPAPGRDVLALTLLRAPEEIVEPAEIIPAPSNAKDSEHKLACKLIESLVDEKKRPFVDQYRARVLAAIEAKAASGQGTVVTTAAAPAPAVMDLEALLAASIGASGKAGLTPPDAQPKAAPKAKRA